MSHEMFTYDEMFTNHWKRENIQIEKEKERERERETETERERETTFIMLDLVAAVSCCGPDHGNSYQQSVLKKLGRILIIGYCRGIAAFPTEMWAQMDQFQAKRCEDVSKLCNCPVLVYRECFCFNQHKTSSFRQGNCMPQNRESKQIKWSFSIILILPNFSPKHRPSRFLKEKKKLRPARWIKQ